MLVAVLLFFVACVNGELVRWRCSEDAGTNLTLNASKDGVLGRYTAELCSNVTGVTGWRLYLWYFEHTAVCNSSHTSPVYMPRKTHSRIDENIELNCTYACLSVDLDLIFTGCFSLQSRFLVDSTSLPPYETYHYIKNKFQLSDFANNKPRVSLTYHSDVDVVVMWYLGIPLEYFKMDLCKGDNTTIPNEHCDNVNENCTSMGLGGSNQLKCSLHLSADGDVRAGDCYWLRLESLAPWASGFLRTSFIEWYSYFCRVSGVVERSGARSGLVRALSWAGGGAALVGAGALALAGAGRARAAAAASKRVLRAWLHRTNAVQVVPAAGEEGEAGEEGSEGSAPDVVLLYARESAAGQRAVDQLRRLLEHATTGKVYDVHSAEVTSLAARAPAAWLHAALQRDNTRVVLLQTPAAALYATRCSDDEHDIKLRAPLLGRRAVYRRPRYGDTLLHYALRLLTEPAPPSAPSPAPRLYRKYYVAQLAPVPTELWPRLVPYRRYSLPAGARLLLRDLVPSASPASPAPQEPQEPPADPELDRLLEQFSHAVHEFALEVAANPDYLTDQLVLL